MHAARHDQAVTAAASGATARVPGAAPGAARSMRWRLALTAAAGLAGAAVSLAYATGVRP